jgi:hypothetical protein
VARVTTVEVGPVVAVLFTFFVLALGGAAWFVTSTMPAIGTVFGVGIVLTGAAIGIGYLARQIVLASRRAAPI